MAVLEEKLDTLPSRPGVYLMRDKGGKVIYVGKAKDLRVRVRAYFRSGDGRSQVAFLMRRVEDVETLVTANEKEALILENNLIKQYKPRYNIRLKDDKSYLSIKINVKHPWPRIVVTRKIVKDGGRYFGPYSSAVAVRETLDIIEKHFLLRNCTEYNFKNRARPCLQYQIKRCLAPCVLPVDPKEYQENLRQAILFIEGKRQELAEELRRRMEERAEALDFEAAAEIRDQLQAIEKTVEKQRMVSHWGADQDIFGLYREGGFIEVQILFVRQGKLTGNQAYSFEDLEFSDEEVIESLLTQFYQGDRFVPEEVLLPVEVEDRAIREEVLSERKGRNVSVVCPQRGDKRQLVEMAAQNARQSFFERHDQDKAREKMLVELQERLRLKHFPQRIECYDISNIQGAHAVGSMVTFFNGEPDKNRYRHYRIRTVSADPGGNDFAMMYEVLKRRFSRGVEEGDLPDLVVVDGGKGQLGMALSALGELNIRDDIDVLGLAKMRVQRAARSAEIERVEERVFLPGRSNPVILKRNSNALFLLQRVRDEAHRFAITYHQKLRAKQTLYSALEKIPGVGGARKRALLRAFGSVKRIEQASLEELLKVPSINEKVAQEILQSVKSASS
ncbi:MAG: excinuclease ABC subunit C [Deltaproteobacteria bacterium RIFCSPLOWO2_12_FULL_60_19]|nr:MAG: excinuclease ABC subunit C [Deltaproteobacteria bacterium RIFCSPLOWO2_12_FULL_60_19]